MPKPKPATYPAEIQSIRSTAIPGGSSLVSDVRAFKMTPVQAVTRFFESGKPSNTGIRYWQTLREVLELLPQCDWENDPSIGSVDGNRWVFMDPDNENRVTTVFTSEQAVIEHGIKPLLGQAFDFKAWVEQLTHGRLLEPEMELQALAAKAQNHAQQMLALESPKFAPPGNPHNNRDNVTVRGQGNGGNSAAYLAARLKKSERDDLLAEIGPGKRFRSVRAAAIEAGIIKPVPTIRVTSDMEAVAAKLCQHLTREQRIQLIDLLAPDL